MGIIKWAVCPIIWAVGFVCGAILSVPACIYETLKEKELSGAPILAKLATTLVMLPLYILGYPFGFANELTRNALIRGKRHIPSSNPEQYFNTPDNNDTIRQDTDREPAVHTKDTHKPHNGTELDLG